MLVLINSILSGALSIAREREEGTFDQLLVAPYTPGEILLGKGTASVITGIIQAVFVVLVEMCIRDRTYIVGTGNRCPIH